MCPRTCLRGLKWKCFNSSQIHPLPFLNLHWPSGEIVYFTTLIKLIHLTHTYWGPTVCRAYMRYLGAKNRVENRTIPCLEEGFTDRHQSVPGLKLLYPPPGHSNWLMSSGWWLQTTRLCPCTPSCLETPSLWSSLHMTSTLTFIFLMCHFDHVCFDHAESMIIHLCIAGTKDSVQALWSVQ